MSWGQGPTMEEWWRSENNGVLLWWWRWRWWTNACWRSECSFSFQNTGSLFWCKLKLIVVFSESSLFLCNDIIAAFLLLYWDKCKNKKQLSSSSWSVSSLCWHFQNHASLPIGPSTEDQRSDPGIDSSAVHQVSKLSQRLSQVQTDVTSSSSSIQTSIINPFIIITHLSSSSSICHHHYPFFIHHHHASIHHPLWTRIHSSIHPSTIPPPIHHLAIIYPSSTHQQTDVFLFKEHKCSLIFPCV